MPPTESFKVPLDSTRTGIIIPVSKETFFNTKWERRKPLCAYDMVFHPPDYDPRSARADRTDPQIIRQNIWDQELHKRISSTTHFMYGRPTWPILDPPMKQFANVKGYELNGKSRRIYDLRMILAPQNCGCPLQDSGVSLVGSSAFCSGLTVFMMMMESFIKGRCDIATPCSNPDPVEAVDDEYDFVVVGAGTAGSIVAGRLSEDDQFKVLLLEAGGTEPIGARIPSLYRTFWFNEEVNWNYRTVPQGYCLDQGGKGCFWPRGKALGGSSLINGMMYHRGHPADYEDWVAFGAEGWSWEENKKYFDMTEGNKQIGSLVSDQYHSGTGPLPVQQFNHQPPFVLELLNAINGTGLPLLRDMTDPNTPDGFMVAQTMNDDGQRYTTARAFLKPRSERPNLHVKVKALVSKVLFNGSRATGVEFIDEDGETRTVRAAKEVILSAGALNSPQILLLSGVGPKETLNRFSIPVVADLPVGQNLRNHVGVTMYFNLAELEDRHTLDWSVLTEYLLDKRGPMSSTAITQLTGLLYSSLGLRARKQPDLQFFFNGFYADCSTQGIVDEPVGKGDCYLYGRNISANAAALLPRSIGFVTINSTNPRDPPLMDPGYFTAPEDMVVVKDGARYLRQILLESEVMKSVGARLDPSFDKCASSGEEWSEVWLECMIRTYTDPQNHQQGTAAIGLVVDPELKVYGIDGLRVIDASAMPTQVTGNPQAAIMMVAERGTAFIKQDWS